MKLSLVVPCYNEQDNVAALYEACRAVFDKRPGGYEMIFINDGSRDNTWGALNALYAAHAQDGCGLKMVNFSRNFGKESAMYAGLQKAEGDYICLIDADLQQRPEIVAQMVDFLDEHPDYDSVAAYQQERIEGKMTSFLKKCFYKLVNRICETDFRSDASDFRTFRRPVAEAILSLHEYDRFSKGIFSWVGFHTHYIPYVAEQRNAGATSWSFRKLFKYAIGGIVSFSVYPLKLATYVGALSALASLNYTLVIIVQKCVWGINVPGYATIVVLLLLIGGLQLITTGIIGMYIARIYIQGKHRPIYIEKDYLNNESAMEKGN